MAIRDALTPPASKALLKSIYDEGRKLDRKTDRYSLDKNSEFFDVKIKLYVVISIIKI